MNAVPGRFNIKLPFSAGRNQGTNFGRPYQFARTMTNEDSTSSSCRSRHDTRKISPWRKIRELNEMFQTTHFNLRESRSINFMKNPTFKTKINPKAIKAKPLAKISNLDQIKQTGFPQKSNRLFLQWKAELERHTDVHPVFDREPPLTVTKPKSFAFKRFSRGKNSPNKGIPPPITEGNNEDISIGRKVRTSNKRNTRL